MGETFLTAEDVWRENMADSFIDCSRGYDGYSFWAFPLLSISGDEEEEEEEEEENSFRFMRLSSLPRACLFHVRNCVTAYDWIDLSRQQHLFLSFYIICYSVDLYLYIYI